MRPYGIRIEYGKTVSGETQIIETEQPVFGWAVAISDREAFAAQRVSVTRGDRTVWDTGYAREEARSVRYAGEKLIAGERYTLRIELMNTEGVVGSGCRDFCLGKLENWDAQWLCAPDAPGDAVLSFYRDFEIAETCESACLFVCGLGYHKTYINGREVFNCPMNPAFSEYEKRAYYNVVPGVEKYLKKGINRIGVRVASGWRNPDLVCYRTGHCSAAYSGKTALSALLRLNMGASGVSWLGTDESWRMFFDAVTSSDLFMGETFDARRYACGWAKAETQIRDAGMPKRMDCPTRKLSAQTLEPVKPQEVYAAQTVAMVGDGVWLADFGQNIAGVCRLSIPHGIKRGTKIVIRHCEFLDETGRLYLPQLRHADSVDTYIAAGDGSDPEFWQPEFTYHGFRYAEISGYPVALLKKDIRAVSLYTDILKSSTFTCGDPAANAFAKMAGQTEKANIHSILTDCPQRDERMGWLNDATVRFEATPYLFDIGRLFPKVVRDIMDVQDKDGSITCTAPFAFGSRPADPVCSSFLVAGWQAWLHTGNADILREAYPAYKAWNDCLERHSENGLVTYSHYGDWAGPAYACEDMENAHSKVTPGLLMSAGYHYYNAVLLGKMAEVIGDEAERRLQAADAQRIRKAFLEKWYDATGGKVATGSQGCQAFALWLDILPEEGREKAARLMRDDLVANDYRFTTGNLCTRYLLEQLARYGYVDEAWQLLCRQEYPSFGYMVQNEATTVWERFELKKNCGMNSHNHPMHASSYRWLYACLCGLAPTDGAWRRFTAKPVMPSKLLSASATVETPQGDATLRWIKRYGETHVYLSVPHGSQADVELPWGTKQTVGEGFHHFTYRGAP